MKPLTDQDPETKSPDLAAENIERLKALFPDAFTEGKIDFEVLKQVLGGTVDEREEKFGLNWNGKRTARQIALTPSTGTLRPCPEESVDWGTTQNLMIEGDNLEVLKLLQKSYAGKVKLIYIDPPYNTGNDFVYPDNFRDNIGNYLELTGQVDTEGRKIVSNTEASGRFHTAWLNMMYPRLKLARNLLSETGVICVSIDDGEACHLRTMMDEIFGPENFVAQIVWEKMYTTKNDASLISTCHDYVVCYTRQMSGSVIGLLPRTEEMNARYSNPDNDPRGPWKAIPLYADGERKNGRFKITSPTGRVHEPSPNSHWRYVENDVLNLIADNRVWFGRTGESLPNQKLFLSEVRDGVKSKTLWPHKEVGSNDTASREVKDLFDTQDSPFSFPKPTTLIQRIIQLAATDIQSVVLDFFAGSGTTAHAVFRSNVDDSAHRRCILVQLPEPLDPDDKEQKAAFDYCRQLGKPCNIAELTKERLRQAGKKIREQSPLFAGDLGFRVFKLASSNIRAWEPDRDNLATTLEEYAEHLRADRTEADILFELLLKLGLDLTVPIEQKCIAGKTVHSIGAGILMVCLAEKITTAEVEPLALGIAAWHKELAPAGESRIVFRDSAFTKPTARKGEPPEPDDVAKTNLTAILQQNGLENVRSL